MSGAEPLRDDRRAAEPNRLEPSMEEILASIRRILAEGQGLWTEVPEREEPQARSERADGSVAAGAANRGCQPAAPDLSAGQGGALRSSGATEASVAAAFHMLVASRLVRDTDLVADLVRDMLRPLLEAWIDEHLPALVERLVAAEIARIARSE